jgi:hypothetical protein
VVSSLQVFLIKTLDTSLCNLNEKIKVQRKNFHECILRMVEGRQPKLLNYIPKGIKI